jgi:hypothetical protein
MAEALVQAANASLCHWVGIHRINPTALAQAAVDVSLKRKTNFKVGALCGGNRCTFALRYSMSNQGA